MTAAFLKIQKLLGGGKKIASDFNYTTDSINSL